MPPSSRTDADLVSDTQRGDRSAFGEIVRRYQTLVCSLAYSATGDLSRSEDLAQDTFFAVWRQLSDLREPTRLRGWICGIARNRIQDSIRRQYREPTHRAETTDIVETLPAEHRAPSDHAIETDEAALVWRTLEQIPEMYREPLVLFYREDQSVAQVATLLDLSEDAVKQRLARGRKLLQAEVAATIEGALRRTAPGPAFTANVIAALPLFGVVAGKTAVAAAATTKGAFSGVLSALPHSPLPQVGALFYSERRMRAFEAASASSDERQILAAHRRIAMRLFIAAAVVIFVFGQWFKRQSHPVWYGPLVPVFFVVPLFAMIAASIAMTRTRLARLWTTRGESPVKHHWEWRTRAQLLGRPLVHVRLGFNPKWSQPDQPVRAWVAVGHVAYGWFFAFGFVAVAPISCGAIAAGVVTIGWFAVGGLALGFLAAAGWIAAGFIAVGWASAGVIAVGFHAAYGFYAYAQMYALCPAGTRKLALALHANDAIARGFVADHPLLLWLSNLFQGDRRTASTLVVAGLPGAIWDIIASLMRGRLNRTDGSH